MSGLTPALLALCAMGLGGCGEQDRSSSRTTPDEGGAPGETGYTDPLDASGDEVARVDGDQEPGQPDVGPRDAPAEPSMLGGEEQEDQAQVDGQERSLPAGYGREGDRQRQASGEGSTRIAFPSDQQPVLVIERRGAEQVRAGDEYAYTLVVTNPSKTATLHDVVIREAFRQSAQEEGHGQHGAMGRQQRQGEQVDDPTYQRQQQQQQQQDPQGSFGQQRDQQGQQGQRSQQGQRGQQGQQGQQGQYAQGQQGQTWRIPVLGPGESKTIESTYIPSREGTFDVCTTATYQLAYCTPIEVVAPALGLQALVVDARGQPVHMAYACDELYLLYRVTNPGSAATQPVKLTHPLPQGVQAQGMQGQQLALQFDPIPPGETVERKVRLLFPGAGVFSGIATAEAGPVSARAPVAGVRVLKPQLQVRIDGPRQTYLGRPATYTVFVTNPSPAPARDAVVRIDAQGARPTISAGNVKEEGGAYQLGTLRPGEQATFALTFEADRVGQLQANVVAEAYCADAVQDQIAAQVIGVPAIRLETIDLTDPVGVGDTVVYEVQVKNQGSAEDMDIRLAAELPPQLRFIDGTGDTQVQGGGQQVQFAPIQRLNPGDVATWRIRAEVLQPGNVRLQLKMQSRANQQPVIEQEPTTLIEAAGQQGQGQQGRQRQR